jgi:riboflavin kinase
MIDIKLQQILTMTQLLLLGAQHNHIEITTAELGTYINRSQQSASKHLLDLENAGYVDRIRRGHKIRIKITDKGYSEIKHIYSNLKSAIESNLRDTIVFEGRVVSGMGEGAYYMSLEGYRKQFKEKLGYEPYPGTLNVKLSDRASMDARRELSIYPSIFIDGFSDKFRTYGWVKCYPAEVNNGVVKNAAVLVLERTHYDDSMIEIIAPVSIKEIARIRNGDCIAVRAQIRKNHNLS